MTDQEYRKKGGGYWNSSIDQLPELVGMVTTAYVVRVIRKDRPSEGRRVGVVRGEITSAMQGETITNKVGDEGEE